jgi:hypothetical protein
MIRLLVAALAIPMLSMTVASKGPSPFECTQDPVYMDYKRDIPWSPDDHAHADVDEVINQQGTGGFPWEEEAGPFKVVIDTDMHSSMVETHTFSHHGSCLGQG